MSYSVCINCERMVPMYEKYCVKCLNRYPQLKQVGDFRQHFYATWADLRALVEKEMAAKQGQ